MRVCVFILAIGLIVIQPTQVFADTLSLEVSGNGADSANEIVQTEDQDTQVDQSNDSQVTTDISVAANTGGNQVNGNTADEINVQTGNIIQEVQVTNESINHNTVDMNCQTCETAVNNPGNEVTINKNGSGSDNTISTTANQSNQVWQSNSASVNTTVSVSANTGNNYIEDNTASQIELRTGNIRVETQILNKNINNSKAKISDNSGISGMSVKVKHNGADSINQVYIDTQAKTIYVGDNRAVVANNIFQHLDTGNNSIKNNSAARITLVSGDILAHNLVKNIDINTNSYTQYSCEYQDPDDPGSDGDDNGKDNGGGDDDGNHGEDNDNGDNNGGDGNNGSSDDNNGSTKGGDNQGGGIGGLADGIGGGILGSTLPATGGMMLYFLGANLAALLIGVWMKIKHSLLDLYNASIVISVEIT